MFFAYLFGVVMKTRGFTLIELMIVVAIIGVLSAVAAPSFGQYMRESRKSEAKSLLRSTADGALSYYNTEHIFDDLALDIRKNFFPGCNDIAPPQACNNARIYEGERFVGQRIDPNNDDLNINNAPWTHLKISIDKPFFYVLSYTSQPNPGNTTFTARATASLNSETDSVFEIIGNGDGQDQRLMISNPIETVDNIK